MTNYVVTGTLNLTREKLGPAVADGLLDRLIRAAHFEVTHTPQVDFNTAQAIFQQYSALSFVDAIIVATVRREGVESLHSFDDDFDIVDGLARLETASNPFA